MRSRFRPRNFYGQRHSKSNNHKILSTIEALKRENAQSYSDKNAYVTKNAFSSFSISPNLKLNISKKGYKVPTPIQDQAIPAIILGKDVIGIANTGTGKTAAFLIPLVNKIINDKEQRVLIITPTRELAIQIHQELKEFAYSLNIYGVLCIGGANIQTQKRILTTHPNFVIGTPGRIKDLIGQRALSLDKFQSVVLDEADRMVDIGFINDIKYFISQLATVRQSLFFSATIGPKEEQILQSFVKDPITISVEVAQTPENINHDIIKVEGKAQKVEKLHDLLISDGFDKVLIFGRTKWGIQKLTEELIRRGFKAGALHGNKSQSQRQKILDLFKNNQIRILLATDVASRGLDIENVSHVINFDMPSSFEDYIHRAGRTGRANKKGTTLTFVG